MIGDPPWLRQIMDKVAADIEHTGLSIIGVVAGADSFYYTIGRAERGLPELIMFSPAVPKQSQFLLNRLDKTMPLRLAHASEVSLGGRFPVLVIDVADPAALAAERMKVTARYYGDTAFDLQQIVLPDTTGRFPPVCDPPLDRVPLLGPMPGVHRTLQ